MKLFQFEIGNFSKFWHIFLMNFVFILKVFGNKDGADKFNFNLNLIEWKVEKMKVFCVGD